MTKNCATIIHLSDIHFKEGKIVISSDKIVAAIRGLCIKCSSFIIVVTGDIAFSGLIAEYTLANKFFDTLKCELEKEFQIDIHFVIVPGNHDCTISGDQEVRNTLIESISKSPEKIKTQTLLSSILPVQENYWNWQQKYTGIKKQEQLVWDQSIRLPNGKTISFRCCNTAWMSEKKEIQGSLLFPVELVKEISPPSDFVITTMHHPFNWFQKTSGRSFMQRAEMFSDLILSGHEHDGDAYSKVRVMERTDYLEGCVYSDHAGEISHGFHVILVDLEKEIYQQHTFSWDENNFSNGGEEGEWFQYIRKRNLSKNRFVPNDDTERYLNDPGLQITHSKKDVTLEDIFIAPDLEVLFETTHSGKTKSKLIRSEKFEEYVFSQKKIRFSGPPQSGKTALAKKIFIMGRKKGLIPIFIYGGDINSSSDTAIIRYIRKAFYAQYENDKKLAEEYFQLGNKKRVIILDKFSYCTLSVKAKGTVCMKLAEYADSVYVFGSDFNEVEEILSEGSDRDLIDFCFCRIKSLGHYLRHQFIKQWFLIETDETLEECDLAKKIKSVEHYVDVLLGKDVVPSYPIFLLIILQQFESNKLLNTSEGSFGYFFDFLIRKAIQTNPGTADQETLFNYLSEFAWKTRNDSSGLDESDYRVYHETYCLDYALDSLKTVEILPWLEEAKLMRREFGFVRFAYRYQRYYFISKFMAENSSADKVVNYLNELIENIHDEDNANILIFLTYHTKDASVLSRLLTHADSVMEEHTECDFNENTAFLSKLLKSVPHLQLEAGNEEEHRADSLHHADQFDEEFTEEDTKQLNEMLSINRAFKTMQVLGQITRNRAGSMKIAEKKELAESCFSVGFRTLGMILEHLRDNLPTIINVLEEKLKKSSSDVSPAERRLRVEHMLFMVSVTIAYGILRRISHSIGSETLIPIFDAIYDASRSMRHDIVDVTLLLDHSKTFPAKRVTELYDKCKKDLYSAMLVKFLVTDYFYMFPVKDRIRQSVCKHLEIELKKSKALQKRNKKV